jgi:hypothetical protein
MTEPLNDNPSPRKDRRAFWLSIIASLCASILFAIFLQPIMTGISNTVVAIIGTLYQGYIDGLFYRAAESPGDSLLYVLFFMVLTLPIILALVASVILRVIEKESSATNITPYLRDSKRERRIEFLIWIIGAMMFLIMTSATFVSITANAKFQRRLMVLSPVISLQERNELLGKWAMMKSYADFVIIKDELYDLAQKNHLELP